MPQAETRVITLDHPAAMEFDSTQSQEIIRIGIGVTRASVRNALFNAAAIIRAPRWQPDVILNGHVVTGPAATVLARRYRARNVLYTFGKEVAGRPEMTAWTLRRSDAGIAVSDFTRSLVVEAFGGRPLPCPVSVIHPGVEVPPAPETHSTVRPTILTTARLRDWYKGHDRILEALPTVLQSIPDAQWIVIGDGPIRPVLEERTRRLNLGDSVRFLGAVSDEERDRWLASANVFAMPARYPKGEIGGEGFPVVYLEAAAWALPAIAGNVGGPREAVLNDQTGLLVNPESSNEIAHALIRLLSDPTYARRLGKQARSRVEDGFRWEQVGAQLENVLRATIGVDRR
ncbi:glycosyltransferase family 4 protein [Xanthobacter dioxanivorans]|uniref:Glycosyltransferase family 4 protein n=2 Tax=Xanthobacter dioxanivorans TaxID=2528964 RepID=A0A974PML1_9HYPH|nr:glycosyltransferase family 4 protein [Xanthobacter dioxanivorans]QRG05971.1 glycosyltransferase family 4 protein [Xanthobacter dioxanivorans]